MHLLLLILLFSEFFVPLVFADSDSCTTFKGTNGTCVNIKRCPFILNLLKRRNLLSLNTQQQLSQSHCGFERLDPKVCCHNDLSDNEESLPLQPIASATLSENIINDFSKHTTCQTASGSKGTCLSVNQCPSLYAIIKEQSTVSGNALQILKQSLCGFEKMIPKVCCNDHTRLIAESTTQSQKIYANRSPSMREECITSRGALGTCVNIKQCQSLFSLLKRSNKMSYEISQTLKEEHCGFENMDPKVCCEYEEMETSTSSGDQQPIPTPPDVTNHPSLSILDHDLCGPISEAKIVGGIKTAVFEFPWMALIAYDAGSGLPEFRCGGSLITKKHVLTAAHCITELPSDLRLIGVRLGEYDLSKERDCDTDINGLDINCAEGYQDFSIMGVALHPNYLTDKHKDDIALIMLDGEANFQSANVRPICLPIGITSLLKSKMTVTGWGATESGPQSQILRKVTLPIIPHEECTRSYKMRNIQISYKQICAGGSNRTDSCSGDSGGPLQAIGMYNQQPRNIIHGIVSFGTRDCGMDDIPGVYTKVEYYLDWILDTIGIDMSD